MIFVRLFLGIFGVALGVLFQAWGLPVFLVFALLLGWAINHQHRSTHIRDISKSSNGTVYYIFQLVAFICIIYFVVIFGYFNQGFISLILTRWDEVSIVSLVLESKYISQRNPLKLGMNLTALATPVIVAVNYHRLASPFPRKTIFMSRKAYFAAFLICAFLPIYSMMETDAASGYMSFKVHSGMIMLFTFQPAILLFLFDHKDS